MIKRIVKLTFKTENIKTFEKLFEKVKKKIRSFPGCNHLELWQCTDDERIFFTYSYWENPSNLEEYRQSELFHATWKQTKILFDDRPEAWSIRMKEVLE